MSETTTAKVAAVLGDTTAPVMTIADAANFIRSKLGDPKVKRRPEHERGPDGKILKGADGKPIPLPENKWTQETIKTLPKKAVQEFYSECGISPETHARVHEADQILLNGARRVTAEDLAATIEEVKKSGSGDIRKLAATISIQTPVSNIEFSTRSHTEGKNPRTGEVVHSYGVSRVKVDYKKKFLSTEAKECEDMIRAAIGD